MKPMSFGGPAGMRMASGCGTGSTWGVKVFSPQWDENDEAQKALRVIVSNPVHGVAALSSPQIMANLLKDLLPDAAASRFARHGRGHRLGGGGGFVRGRHAVQAGGVHVGGQRDRRGARPQQASSRPRSALQHGAPTL